MVQAKMLANSFVYKIMEGYNEYHPFFSFSETTLNIFRKIDKIVYMDKWVLFNVVNFFSDEITNASKKLDSVADNIKAFYIREFNIINKDIN